MSYEVRNAHKRATMSDHEFSWNRERGECFNEAHGPFSTVEVFHKYCEVNSHQCEFAEEYGEPGYTHPGKGVLFANWNRVPKLLADRLEAQGYELEYSDEWYVDCDKTPAKAWRTSPDHHGWESRVRACDGYMLTPDSDPQKWIDGSINENSKPLPSWFDDTELETRGFGVLEQPDKEVGFHPGQNELPEHFTPALRKEGFDFVLQVTGRGQFDVAYRVWTRKVAEHDVRARYCELDDQYYVHK